MEMDIPDLDELQWLEEANSHLPEQDETFPELDYELEIAQSTQPQTNHQYNFSDEESEIPIPQIPSIASNSKKRSRSPSPLLDLDAAAADNCVRVRTEVPVAETLDYELDDFVPPEIDEGKYLSCFASEIDGEFMPVTAPSGSSERVYAKLEKGIFGGRNDDSSVSKFKMVENSSGLLSAPVRILIQKAEQDALLKALRASSEVPDNTIHLEKPAASEELWVNKYAPKSFTELLSDEHTNREVLFWLKQWDPSVFGTEIRNTGDDVLSALRRHSSIPQNKKLTGKNFMRSDRGPRSSESYIGHSAMTDQEHIKVKDITGLHDKKLNGSRTPEQKILLLCGPPGLGKTTLAHVAAKHCGYHVMEINASDDRSSTTIEAKILDAVQMNSIMAGSKPKCLVIDEIDGALGEGKGAVEVILKMVAADKKSHAGKERSKEELSGRKSKNRSKSMSLSRPVICICNDLYAPALRPLRLVAKVYVFPKPTVSRVVSRLKYICNKEHLKTNSIVLTALAEYTECDIRSCLNTLQFVHKKKETLNLAALSSQIVGQKDITRSVFDVWKEIFQKKKTKQAKHHMAAIRTDDTSNSLYTLISGRGDYELILDGIHENFLQLRYHDPLMQKTVHCLNALGVSDLIHSCVMRSYNMSLYVYHAPVTIMIHRLVAHVERPNIEWPKSFHRCRTLRVEKIEVLKLWLTKVAPLISRHLSVNTFVEDTVSLLLDILSPADLRPVALHLLSEKERSNLAQLVGTMVAYSLTYKHKKYDPINHPKDDEMVDTSLLCLEPPIEGFVSFKDYKLGHYELKSAVKQVIVHEVEKQKIVKESTCRSMHSVESSQKENIAANEKENDIASTSKFHEALHINISAEKTKNMSQKMICETNAHKSSLASDSGRSSADMMKVNSAGNTKKPPVGSVNFFARFKKLGKKGDVNADSSAMKPATIERDVRPLLFKFNEGFTNAVKRPVRIREFLL